MRNKIESTLSIRLFSKYHEINIITLHTPERRYVNNDIGHDAETLIVIVIGDEEIEHDTPLYNLILSKL